MKLTYKTIELDLEFPFRISRGEKFVSKTIITQLEHTYNGQTYFGFGEAVFSEFYGENEDSVSKAYKHIIKDGILQNIDLFNEQELQRRIGSFGGNYAAKAGLNIALYDLRAKVLGLPLYKFLGSDKTKAPQSSYTIGIADKETIVQKVKTALDRNYKILKVKLGSSEDLEMLKTIRSLAPQATIRVDANAAWTYDEEI